jgi:hypothetical protein
MVGPAIVLLDIFLEIYHRLGFPLCEIPLVKRSKYIRIDRHKLQYLRWDEKLACMYCGYANGFAAYFSEIAGRTEKYWCAIKHNETPDYNEQAHHKEFIEYGDEKAYKDYKS